MKLRLFSIFISLTIVIVSFQNCSPTSGFKTSDLGSNSNVVSGQYPDPSPTPEPTPSPQPQPNPLPNPQPPVTPSPIPQPTPEIATNYINKNWPALRERLKGARGSGYNLQILIQPFVEWIAENKRKDLAREVLDVYALTLPSFTTEKNLTVYGGPNGQIYGYATVPVLSDFSAWVSNSTPRIESVLDMSQFTFAISRLVNILDANDPRVAQWTPLLKSHYLRWIRGIEQDPKKGVFQVIGWGCSFGRFNHLEHTKNKLLKAYGVSKSYCNCLDDVDLWIISGAAQMIQLHIQKPELKFLTADEASFLLSYVKTGIELISSRLIPSTVTIDGVSEKALLFDPGSWRDHPDSQFAGYSGTSFPTTPVKGPPTLTFDISHMRRVIPVFEVLYNLKSILGTNFPTSDQVRQVALQLSFGVFNGDYTHPYFTNFGDGTNGWYRVNYNDRPGFAYPPFSMSLEWLSSGYCQFSKFEPRIRKICNALVTRLQSQTAVDLNYRIKLSECYMSEQKMVRCENPGLEQVNFNVLGFLSSLR